MDFDARFNVCIAEGKLEKIGLQKDLVEKELRESKSDFESAKLSLFNKNFKWATVQSYYSMFHAAKALVLSKGYREKSHFCLLVALNRLFVDSGLLDEDYFQKFRDCMNLRHDADYGLIYSKESAEEVVLWAGEFLKIAKKLV